MEREIRMNFNDIEEEIIKKKFRQMTSEDIFLDCYYILDGNK